MFFYDEAVVKALKNERIPREIIQRFHNAFRSLDLTGDYQLFDIKRLKSHETRSYYRLRKGHYRAIFFRQEGNIYVIALGKREEVYRSWG